jgi:hypothetical protein
MSCAMTLLSLSGTARHISYCKMYKLAKENRDLREETLVTFRILRKASHGLIYQRQSFCST